MTTPNEAFRYLFGPVSSRRLGLSLGVDIVPFKTCSYDCVYCQLGKTHSTVLTRKSYVNAPSVIEELSKKLNQKIKLDFITFSGSGEPTLNSDIGKIISEIKKISKKPVCVITNGSLLHLKKVRDDLKDADLVIPSLDAGTKETFEKINRPQKDLDFNSMVKGLIKFSEEFKGDIRLEIFLIDGINTNESELEKIRDITRKISPKKIELNSVDRPPADSSVQKLDDSTLEKIRNFFGERAYVIQRKDGNQGKLDLEDEREIIALLKRRPCNLDDIAQGLNANMSIIKLHIEKLKDNNKVEESLKEGVKYYHCKR